MKPQTAIVTGGSTGIGVAICRALLDQGYEVICLSRRDAGVRSPRLRSVSVDLSDATATKEVAAEIAKQEAVCTIVHNAGAILEKPLAAVELGDVDALAHLHLSAPISLVQANLPAMQAASYGRIVLISSRAVLGLARRTSYAATKAGMLGLVRTWALELGPMGITANAVAPGPIEDTEMFDGVVPQGAAVRQSVALLCD